MSIIWKSSELKESSDFKNILTLEGTVESLSEGSWGEESKFGDSAYTQVNLIDVEILGMKDDAPAPQLIDDRYNYRINQSVRKNSKWAAFIGAAEVLGIDLPDGIEGNRYVFEVMEGGSGKGVFSVLVPISLVGGAEPVDVEARVVELMEAAGTEKAFKRACMLDAVVGKDKNIMEGVRSGDFLAGHKVGVTDEGNLVKA